MPARKPRPSSPPTAAELSRLVTVAAVAKAYAAPTDEWKGNCHGLATATAKLIPHAVVTRGFWTGPISRRSFFSGRASVGFTGHSWVTTKDGLVVDPTRWVFEAALPYVFVGREDPDAFVCEDFEPSADVEWLCKHCDCGFDVHLPGFFKPCTKCCGWPYDAGGNAVRAAFQRPPPKVPARAKRDFVLALPADAVERARLLLGDGSIPHRAGRAALTKDQGFWLANVPLPALEPFAKAIYSAIAKAGHEVWVPLDNFGCVMGRTVPDRRTARRRK